MDTAFGAGSSIAPGIARIRIAYVQPRLDAGRNYRSGGGAEQVWCPWWALLLHGSLSAADGVLIDARTMPDWRDRLAAVAGPGVVVAVSVMTGHAITDAIDASDIAKQAGARVVWGGPHPTLFPDQVAAEPFVDHVVTGFGSATFARLVDAIRASTPAPLIAAGRGTSSLLPVTLLKQPTSSAPFTPALELVSDWQPYVNSDHALTERAVNLITSEGCLRRCTYCSEPSTSGHSWLAYDVAQCADVAVQVLADAGADSLKLHDPNFLHDVDRGLRFARLLRDRAPVRWAATIHPDDLIQIDEARLAELAGLGLSRVLVGLESPVQELVNLAGKRYDVQQIPYLTSKLARHGVAGMFTFIVGWPDADPSHYRATIDAAFAIKAVWPDHQAKIHFLEPWPGTPMSKIVDRRGHAPAERSLREWAEIDYYFAHLPLHDSAWEPVIRQANEELSPYVEA